MLLLVGKRAYRRETERDRERARERDRETTRQRGQERERERERERETDRQTETERKTELEGVIRRLYTGCTLSRPQQSSTLAQRERRGNPSRSCIVWGGAVSDKKQAWGMLPCLSSHRGDLEINQETLIQPAAACCSFHLMQGIRVSVCMRVLVGSCRE